MINIPLKYVHTETTVCLIHQFQRQPKMANYDNIQKYKTYKYNLYNTWRKKRKNM